MEKNSRKPAFLIQMLDYQNTTWQGTVTYLDTNQKIPFRSVLELIKLMDSAIGLSGQVQGFSAKPSDDPENPVSES